MREAGRKPDTEPETEPEAGKKRIELSVAQVAGSALATVAAAVLASQMGVYGTVIGAGVMSVVATAGGTVFQHFFRRTGEQIREVKVRPKGRQVPFGGPVVRTDVPETFRAHDQEPFFGQESGGPAADWTTVLPQAHPADAEATALLPQVQEAQPPKSQRTQLIRAVDATGRPPRAGGEATADAEATRVLTPVGGAGVPGRPTGDVPADPEATQLLGKARAAQAADATQALPAADATQLLGPRAVDDATRVLRQTGPGLPHEATADGRGADGEADAEEFTEATTHGSRLGRWKRSLVTAGVVFGVAMGGITGYELLAGHSLSGDTGPTISQFGRGSHQTDPDPTPSTEVSPEPTDGGTATDGTTEQDGGGTPQQEEGATPTPTPSDGGTGTSPGTGTDPDSGSGNESGGASEEPTPDPSTEPGQTQEPSDGATEGDVPQQSEETAG